jgi:uncharacterized protein YukE
MDVGGLLARFAPPPGDAGRVRAVAAYWRDAADQVQHLTDSAGISVATLASSWSGPASTGFAATWRALAAHLADGSGQLRAAAEALDRAARAIEEAKARYWQLMAGAGVGVAAGVLLTPVTLGASDVIAEGAVAGELAVLLASLADALGVEASILAGIAATAGRLLAAFTVQTGAMAATDVVTGAVLFPDHDPLGHVDVRRALQIGAVGAVAAPLGATLARGLAGAAPRLAEPGVAGAVTHVVLDGGSFGLADTAAQLAVNGHADPGEVAFATLGASVGSAAGRVLLRSGVRETPLLEGGPDLPVYLARVLHRSTAVPAGRSFFSPDRDPWLARAAPLVPREPGAAVVFAHGTTTHVVASGAVLTPHELAAIIQTDPLLRGRRIRLFACETGRLDDGFAAQLARELGVEVEAPTQLAWLGPGGQMSTTSGRLVDDSWVQTVPHDGRWAHFRPAWTLTTHGGRGGPRSGRDTLGEGVRRP